MLQGRLRRLRSRRLERSRRVRRIDRSPEQAVERALRGVEIISRVWRQAKGIHGRKWTHVPAARLASPHVCARQRLLRRRDCHTRTPARSWPSPASVWSRAERARKRNLRRLARACHIPRTLSPPRFMASSYLRSGSNVGLFPDRGFGGVQLFSFDWAVRYPIVRELLIQRRTLTFRDG